MTKETSLTVPGAELGKITTGLQLFEERKAELEALAESAKIVKINGLEDKKAYSAVRAKRIELRDAEIIIEKEAKAMRDLVTPISRHISAKEKELIKITEAEKTRLISEEKWFVEENEKIAQAKQAEERAKIQRRIDALASYGVALDYSAVLSYSESEFQAQLEAAKISYAEEQEKVLAEKLRLEEVERLRQEKIEAERIELEKIRAEQEKVREEQERKEAEIRQELERIQKGKAAIEQAKIDEANRIKREKEIEQAKKEAAERVIKEEQEKVEKAKAEEARRIALMPDKEKLLQFAEGIEKLMPGFSLSDDKAEYILRQSEIKLIEVQKYIIDSVNKL